MATTKQNPLKARIHTNIWGNTYGYLGNKRVAMFCGYYEAQIKDGKKWLEAVSKMTRSEQEDVIRAYEQKCETYEPDAAIREEEAAELEAEVEQVTDAELAEVDDELATMQDEQDLSELGRKLERVSDYLTRTRQAHAALPGMYTADTNQAIVLVAGGWVEVKREMDRREISQNGRLGLAKCEDCRATLNAKGQCPDCDWLAIAREQAISRDDEQVDDEQPTEPTSEPTGEAATPTPSLTPAPVVPTPAPIPVPVLGHVQPPAPGFDFSGEHCEWFFDCTQPAHTAIGWVPICKRCYDFVTSLKEEK